MSRFNIYTERIVLTPLGTDFLKSVNEYALDYENTKYMCHLPKKSSDETLDFLRNVESEWNKEKPDFYEFAILYQDRHIGAVSVYFENGTGELGWIVNKQYWGRGFAYEATKAVIHYFAANMGTTHFIAHCDTANIASYKTMEKLGMIRTGEYGGRKNRAANQESFEYQYEMVL